MKAAFLLVLSLLTLAGVRSAASAELHRFATVAALAVHRNATAVAGNIHYIVIQLDRDLFGRGPTIQFSEQFRGSLVGSTWKEGVRTAVQAAAAALGEEPRFWTVTIKNASYSNFTDGSSASAAVAVGLMAAARSTVLRSDIVLTGVITPQGRIDEVEGLPLKLEGAAAAKMRTMLVPKGQARTPEWDLYEASRSYGVTVLEVATLQEAFELMTAGP
jgi:predicted S18 family serine protease